METSRFTTTTNQIRTKKSADKVLCSFFRKHKGIILEEPTPVGITITKTYYEDILMNKLHPEIKKRWRGLISTGVILHHDNASAYTAFLVSSTNPDLKYRLLRHPPGSPDLIPSGYFLVLVLKDYLKGIHYKDRSSLGSSIYQCLNSVFEDDFIAAI